MISNSNPTPEIIKKFGSLNDGPTVQEKLAELFGPSGLLERITKTEFPASEVKIDWENKLIREGREHIRVDLNDDKTQLTYLLSRIIINESLKLSFELKEGLSLPEIETKVREWKELLNSVLLPQDYSSDYQKERQQNLAQALTDFLTLLNQVFSEPVVPSTEVASSRRQTEEGNLPGEDSPGEVVKKWVNFGFFDSSNELAEVASQEKIIAGVFHFRNFESGEADKSVKLWCLTPLFYLDTKRKILPWEISADKINQGKGGEIELLFPAQIVASPKTLVSLPEEGGELKLKLTVELLEIKMNKERHDVVARYQIKSPTSLEITSWDEEKKVRNYFKVTELELAIKYFLTEYLPINIELTCRYSQDKVMVKAINHGEDKPENSTHCLQIITLSEEERRQIKSQTTLVNILDYQPKLAGGKSFLYWEYEKIWNKGELSFANPELAPSDPKIAEIQARKAEINPFLMTYLKKGLLSYSRPREFTKIGGLLNTRSVIALLEVFTADNEQAFYYQSQNTLTPLGDFFYNYLPPKKEDKERKIITFAK